MRIISGKWGGLNIRPPANMPYTRPTTDMAKEGLFNVLENNLTFGQLKSLDLFGGTGSITYELASRGVPDLTIVEKDPDMHAFILKKAKEMNIPNIKVIKNEVFRFVSQCTEKFDLIFAGPPYALSEIDELPLIIFKHGLLNENGWFVLEHTPRNDYKNFAQYRAERKYGTTIFSIFINNEKK
jgi:16S rRNA (guanine966-N2)-methyltransferase